MILASDIKDIVKNNTVNFEYFRQGHFYYQVCVPGKIMARAVPPTGPMYYTFPVPLEDIGDATLEVEDSAIYFMRYIRKAIADGTFVPFGNRGA